MDSDLLSNVSNIAICVSAFAVAIMALIGVNTWRRELKGKTKYELARSLIVVCRKLQADFEWARFPITSSGEFTDRPKLENESAETSKVLDLMWARGQRLKPLIDNLRQLQELAWEAEAVLDDFASNRVDDVRKLLREKYAHLETGMDEYFDLLHDEAKGRDISQHQDWLKELRKDVYGLKVDEFSKEIDKSIENLAMILKHYLK